MRRVLPVGLLILLSGCGYVGNPVDGIGSFLGDTISFSTNPNRPAATSPMVQRVSGQEVTIEPLREEEGNVWPGPLPPAKTMSDLQREGLQPIAPEAEQAPRPAARGSSMAPQSMTTPPAARGMAPPPNQPAQAAAPMTRVLQTPAGPAITNRGGNGIETFTLPSGKTGTVMSNGNGTATLINSDGSSMIVPLPR